MASLVFELISEKKQIPVFSNAVATFLFISRLKLLRNSFFRGASIDGTLVRSRLGGGAASGVIEILLATAFFALVIYPGMRGVKGVAERRRGFMLYL